MYGNLRAEMARAEISQKELSKRMGWKSNAKLSIRMNNPDKSFSLDEALKIKEILQVDLPLEELFKR